MIYRREIDGLRAVAVIPVILFHAGFALASGGFIGVDVFFVISGYLITSKILADRAAGTFSILDFYERRARRILPALFVVLFASTVLALLWLLPDDLTSFSDSLIAVNGFVSNVFFFVTTGYFAPDADLRPLLHTWSLAVEEQYYLLYPFFLAVVWRLGTKRIVRLLAFAALVSLASAQWGSVTHPRYTFFMLHTRAWEILVGALIAFSFERRTRAAAPDGEGATSGAAAGVLAEIGAAAGIGLIVAAVWGFDAATPSPSLYTVIPIAGAALVIVYATPRTYAGRLLGSAPLVGIGLVSYSAYLWHQPLFAFAKYRSADPPSSSFLIALAVVAMGLAFVSWKYVESPFRNRRTFTRGQIVRYGLACSAVLVSVGLAGHFTKGLYSRFSSEEVRILRYTHYDYKNVYRAGACFLDENQSLPFDAGCGAAPGQGTLIWGDSHAAALSGGLRHVFTDVIQYTASRCLPIKDEFIADRPECKAINDFVVSQVPRLRPRQVFLHADWRRHKNQDPATGVRATIDFIRQASPETRMTVIGGVPQWYPTLPILFLRRHLSIDGVSYTPNPTFDEVSEVDRSLEAMARDKGVGFFSVLRALCQGKDCRPTAPLNGMQMLTTWDYGHMTEAGSTLVATKLRDALPAAAP